MSFISINPLNLGPTLIESDAIGDDKVGVAKSLFNEPPEEPTVEPESNETDNGDNREHPSS